MSPSNLNEDKPNGTSFSRFSDSERFCHLEREIAWNALDWQSFIDVVVTVTEDSALFSQVWSSSATSELCSWSEQIAWAALIKIS